MVVSRRGRLAVAELPCRLVDPDLFFAETPADVEVAKALCEDCPIREACLAGALQRREPWGVWGGQLFAAGVVVPHKRRHDTRFRAARVGGRAPEDRRSEKRTCFSFAKGDDDGGFPRDA